MKKCSGCNNGVHYFDPNDIVLCKRCRKEEAIKKSEFACTIYASDDRLNSGMMTIFNEEGWEEKYLTFREEFGEFSYGYDLYRNGKLTKTVEFNSKGHYELIEINFD